VAPSIMITPTRLVDVWAFNRMRPGDAAEVQASSGQTPVEAVLDSWSLSRETWTVRFNGEVGAVFGVAEHEVSTVLNPIHVVWLLTTDVIERYRLTFYKASRKVLPDLVKRYGTLFNLVDTRYTRAINWAYRIGFRLGEPVAEGLNGELFTPIIIGD
jgi:hypothetical protein